MALVKVDTWDNTVWDNKVAGRTIAIGDTFTVSAIDLTNCVVAFAPGTTTFTKNLVARTWDNNYQDLTALALTEAYTVTSLDYNNRIVWLIG